MITNRKIDYDDCINFVKNVLHIRLFNYQKEILKAFIGGREVCTARGIGRTYVADVFGKYIAHVYDKNDYSKHADVTFPYHYAIANGLYSSEFAEQMREYDETRFKTEFLCKNNGDSK